MSQGGFEGIAPNTVGLNEWHYVTWTFDEQFHRFYDNGIEVFSAPYTQPWVGNDLPLQIGQNQKLPISNFRGMIDEARIYRGALTRDEILRDMRSCGIPEAAFSLLSNGCFEQDMLGWLGWSTDKLLTSETAYDGQNSAKFLLGKHSLKLRHQSIPITGGRSYQVEAAIKTVNATGPAFVRLTWTSPFGKALRIDTFGYTSGTTDWVLRSSAPLTAPLRATQLKLELLTENGGGSVYFDHVRVNTVP